MMIIPNAALLHFNDDGFVLAVERKDNKQDRGLPGGKADPDDIIAAGGDPLLALKIACSRESLEECGLVIFPHDLQEVFRGPCATPKRGGTWPNVVFMPRRVVTTVPQKKGEPPFYWVPPCELISRSPFREFNRALFDALGVVY
jgi:8-oxo-dGTP pyrophosphatase MutT (NUDIX family)